MTRAVIYARYSSDNQREASIKDQVYKCTQELTRLNARCVNTYTDAAISGSTRLRPAFQRLLQDARASAFDLVIAEALDRLSRDQEDVAGLFKQLKFQGIQLITLSEGEITELHIGLKGTMNALFLKDLAIKTHRGMEGQVRRGKSAGGKAYGYDVVRQYSEDGSPISGERKINRAEAEVVQRIFTLFAAGQSPRSIARSLNEGNVPSPGGRLWSDTTIRGHATRRTGVLRNDLYRGKLLWNKQHYVKDPNTGRRLARLNPAKEWIWQDVPGLRVIDDRLWDAVQERLDGIRSSTLVKKALAQRIWEKRRAKHLLTGLTKCGICGGSLTSVGGDYLACSKARKQGTCTNKRGVRRHLLENLVLTGLKDNLMKPEMVEEFVRAYHEEINKKAADQGATRDRVEAELGKVTKKLDALIDAVASGYRSDSLQLKLDSLEEKKSALEIRLTEPAPSPVRFHPKLPELYRKKVEYLGEALSDPTIRDEAFSILRDLIQGVVVTPGPKRSFSVELIGEITKMIALPDDKAMIDESSVKVVAGPRFEPTVRPARSVILVCSGSPQPPLTFVELK